MNKTIQSSHKTFNRKANADIVTSGNVSGKVQSSSYIRSSQNTTCNNREFPLCQLQDSDMAPFERSPMVSQRVCRAARELADKHDGVILYVFYHRVGKRRIVHGCIITRTEKGGHGVLAIFPDNNRPQTRSILSECARVVSMG